MIGRYLLPMFQGHRNQEIWMSGACATLGKTRKYILCDGMKTEVKSTLARPRHRCKAITETDVKEIIRKGLN